MVKNVTTTQVRVWFNKRRYKDKSQTVKLKACNERLEAAFKRKRNPQKKDLKKIAQECGIYQRQVEEWFKDRRLKDKNEKIKVIREHEDITDDRHLDVAGVDG